MIDVNISKKLKGKEGSFDLIFNGQWCSEIFTSIYGPSGAGKTSVLRMLAGLMKPDRGHIIIDDKIWFDSQRKIDLKPQERDVGLVFQEPSLFPNMTVEGNISFALGKNQSSQVVDQMIGMLELGELRKSMTNELSGGQKQRVALARSLVRKPKLLLLDEPLSALDQAFRGRMQDLILQVHKQFNLNTVLVSHQLDEVLKMSDHILVLTDGRIVNQGKPSEIFPVSDGSDDLEIEVAIVEMDSDQAIVLVNSRLFRIDSQLVTIDDNGKAKISLKTE